MTTQHAVGITLTTDASNAITEVNRLERSLKELMTSRALISQHGGDTKVIDQQIMGIRRLQAQLLQQGGVTTGLTLKTKKLRSEMNQMTKGNGRLQQAFGQLAFAGEDFMSVIDTMGVRGGLRAAGNNLSMVARIAGGPVMGGLLGIGLVAIPSMLGAMEEGEKGVNSFADSLTRLAEAQDLVRSKALEHLKAKFKLEDVKANGFKDPDQGSAALQKTKRELEEVELELDLLKDKAKQAGDDVWDNLQPKLGLNLIDMALRDMGNFKGKVFFRKRLDVIKQELQQDLVRLADAPDEAIKLFQQKMQHLVSQAQGSVPIGKENIAGALQLQQELNNVLDVTNDLIGNEEFLVQAKESVRDALDGIIDKEDTRQKILERQTAEIKAQAAARAKESQEAIKALNESNRSTQDQLRIKLRAEQEKLLDTAKEANLGGGQGQAELQKANTRLLTDAADDLKEALGINADVYKEAALTGPNTSEAVAAAKSAAVSQVQEADTRAKEHAEDLKVLNEILRALRTGTRITIPLP